MEIVFATSFYNHHQAAISSYLDKLTDHDFTFVETSPMDEGRKSMGWSVSSLPEYVRQAYASPEAALECQRLIDEADVVIWGACPFDMIKPRLRQGKLTFCYSERIFKKGYGPIAFGGRAVKYFLRLFRYQKNHYLLGASAYASGDYGKIGQFRGKAFKWGYFPEAEEKTDVDLIMQKKCPATVLWAGRMIPWKHPEIAVDLAEKLKASGMSFELTVIGDGECFSEVKNSVKERGLEDCVRLLGAMPPDKVRSHMEESDVFLFTSDRNEGWGAVVNEAMSSGCAVVASDAAGAVRYLVRHGENGAVYSFGNNEDMYQLVRELIENRALCQEYGRAAYKTMETEWSAEMVAERFIALAKALQDGRELIFESGPCSRG